MWALLEPTLLMWGFNCRWSRICSTTVMIVYIQALYTIYAWLWNNQCKVCLNFPYCRDHYVCAPSQWETALQCNAVPHWLGAYTKWVLYRVVNSVGTLNLWHVYWCHGTVGRQVIIAGDKSYTVWEKFHNKVILGYWLCRCHISTKP